MPMVYSTAQNSSDDIFPLVVHPIIIARVSSTAGDADDQKMMATVDVK